MLVRADLFAELGGFDAKTFPGAEDLDLCWRARIAGARVMVAPDARVRHRQADKVHDTDEAVSPAVRAAQPAPRDAEVRVRLVARVPRADRAACSRSSR